MLTTKQFLQPSITISIHYTSDYYELDYLFSKRKKQNSALKIKHSSLVSAITFPCYIYSPPTAETTVCVVTLEYSDLVQKRLLKGFLFEVRHIYLYRLELRAKVILNELYN